MTIGDAEFEDPNESATGAERDRNIRNTAATTS